MLLFTQWISLFAHRELAYSSAMSHTLLSFYSLGSISGVLVVFSLLSRKIAEIKILLLTNFLSLISLLIILNTRLIWLSAMATFIFGFTTAGGAMQVALNLFLKLYPDHKSLVTGSYFIFGSVASITIPVLTGLISQSSLTAVLDVDVVISLLASLTVGWAYYLLKPVFYKKISV
ncbi:MFS transporter [Oenococcus sp. UCMA 14587]|nr:MFS transporter [Oenococcus sp. UCMA 14587]